MTQTVIDDRFKKLGPYAQDELIRDLKTLVNEINLRLVDSTTNEELAALGASLAGTYASLAYLAANYTTTANLTMILSGYVTAASLSLTLAGYSTTTAMNTAITASLTGILANIKAISWIAGDLIGFNGANTPVRVPKGTTLQVFRMNAAATAQEYVEPGNLTYLGEIGNAIDLDTLTVAGFWQQSDDSEAAAGTHYPIAKAGRLDIQGGFGASGVIYQQYTTYASQATWKRVKNAGTWSTWTRQIDGNVPIFSVGGLPAGFPQPTTVATVVNCPFVYLNIGTYYSTATGLFTAPYAGNYEFHFRALKNGGNALHTQMFKNGSGYGSLSFDNNANYAENRHDIILPLVAGDTIGIYVIAGYYIYPDSPSGGQFYTIFTGNLVG